MNTSVWRVCFRSSHRFGRWKNRYFDHQSRAFVEQPMASAFLVRHDVLRSHWRLGRAFLSSSSLTLISVGALSMPGFASSLRRKQKHITGGGSTRKEGSWLILIHTAASTAILPSTSCAVSRHSSARWRQSFSQSVPCCE